MDLVVVFFILDFEFYQLLVSGNTSDYHGMITDLSERCPATKFVCVGFSMGGNLITKYLGEDKRSKHIVAGISVCQGYDAIE